jgi:hypothetical protein
MARARLSNTFASLLTLEDVQALAPDIIAALEEPSPADLMFANDIRMGALQALVKYRFREGIRLSVKFARTQSQHGSESRTGVILGMLKTYGAASREVLPELKELLAYCKTEPHFPQDCRDRKIASVEDAIKFAETAQEQPELRSLAPVQPKGGSDK